MINYLGITQTITNHPINNIVNVGASSTFTIVATGTITGYQWQISTNGGITFSDIITAGSNPTYSGWTSNTLTISGITLNENGEVYRCQVYGSSVSNIETFSTPGTTNWLCPAGVTSVAIQCWGAGGAGGSCPAGSSIQNSSGGGGGGAFSSSIISVVPGTSYPYTIGAGGAPTGTSGNSGGNTNFNNNTVLAVGGQGGQWRSPDGYNPGGAAGAGGTIANSIGTTKFSGGNGNAGSIGYCGGGAGGGAGNNGNGGNAPGGLSWSSGSGGTAGGGNGGAGGSNADRGTYTGAGGNSIGGGGGGSSNFGWSQTATYGGSGGNGALKILYNAVQIISSNTAILYVSTPPSSSVNSSSSF